MSRPRPARGAADRARHQPGGPRHRGGLQNVWGHGGDAPGYAAGMLYLVDHDVVIGLTDNTEHEATMEVGLDLIGVALDGLE